MESTLITIMEHIKSVLPQIQTIDEDYGQLEALDQQSTDEYPLTFPAVLIDIPQTEWTDLAGKSQKGRLSIRVRLALDCYDDTHYGSSPEAKIKERAALAHTLHQSLQSFRPCADGNMSRESSRFYTLSHGIKVYETTYTITLSDIILETTQVVSHPKLVLSAKKL